jgi:putative hydrolase of the HAD superfamily
MRSVLDRLAAAGFDLGIITNGGTLTQKRKIDILGIKDLMKIIVISEEAGLAKPAAAIFQHACAGLALSPEAVWFVGDNPVNDAIGARAAGMIDVWLRGYATWPAESPAATITIDRLEQLPELL